MKIRDILSHRRKTIGRLEQRITELQSANEGLLESNKKLTELLLRLDPPRTLPARDSHMPVWWMQGPLCSLKGTSP